MYHVGDKSAAVRNVQRMLDVQKSGIYDNVTRKNVASVQKKYGIEESGVVDLDTFDAIRDFYCSRRRELLYRSMDRLEEFPYGVGDYGADVACINRLLDEMLGYYGIKIRGVRGSLYTAATSEAVRTLRKIFGLGGVGELDSSFYERIKRESLTRTMLNPE